MKLSIPHWVIVLVTLLGTVAPQVGQAFPALAPAMGIVVQLATLVVGALGIVTGSALTKGGGGSGTGGSGLPVQTRTVPPKVDAVSDAASKLSKRVALGFGVAAIAVELAVLPGCSWLEGTAFPTLNTIEQVVAKDLAEGASDEQMASDVCADLGGSATTDAVCAGAAQLVTDAVTLLEDSGVLGDPSKAKAHANAQAYLARHPKAAK